MSFIITSNWGRTQSQSFCRRTIANSDGSQTTAHPWRSNLGMYRSPRTHQDAVLHRPRRTTRRRSPESSSVQRLLLGVGVDPRDQDGASADAPSSIVNRDCLLVELAEDDQPTAVALPLRGDAANDLDARVEPSRRIRCHVE